MSNERYGRSFVQELLDDGNEEEALAAAEREIGDKPEAASAHYDHALVLEALERGEEALAAYERALSCNQRERTVEGFVLDDAYFSALLDVAQTKGRAGLEIVARYRVHAPDGAHLSELGEWEARLAGRAPSLLDKTK